MYNTADAVYESVAQVLLSRSRGLKSRFEQSMMKADAEVSSLASCTSKAVAADYHQILN